MNEKDSQRRTPLQELIMGVALVVVVGAAIMVGAWAVRLHNRERELSSLGAKPALPPKNDASNLRKLVEWEHDQNLAAIEMARRRLDVKFSVYAERIPDFTDALNSMAEKLRLGKDMVQDKVQSAGHAREEVMNLFATKVVSDAELRSDITDVIAHFRSDVEGNRAAILAAAGPDADLPKAPEMAASARVDALVSEFKEGIAQFLKLQVEQMPETTADSVTKSAIMAEAMGKRIRDAIKAHDSDKEGGETPSDAKRATIIGTAVGVLAGAADYWLIQSHAESVQTNDCQAALDTIRDTLWTDPRNGLAADFTRYVDLVRVIHAPAAP